MEKDASTTAADVTEADSPPELGRAMGKGLGWSLLNNVIGRLGNFLSGIVIVRILSTSEYGVYAVGLVVLTVLLSMNELGVSVAIVQRKGRVDNIAPTVMTLSLISSSVLALLAFFAAPSVARGLGTPEATWLIRLLLVGVLIDGAAAVPNALITRSFAQRTRLRIDLIAFLVGTPITIGLAIAGFGAWSLGWGAVAANLLTGILAFAWAPERYRPGLRRESVGELLHFGLPLAGASLLLFMMLNVDYVVVGHRLGPTELGLYLLAFNLCSWPISVISTAIRRVTLASFARMSEQHADGGREGFAQTVGLVMAVTLPVCVVLGAYAGPVIEVLYGPRWLPAAQALRLLAVLGATRVAVELTYDYLAATGRTRSNLWLHGVWLVVLIPSLIIGADVHGIEGVAAGHAIVSVALVIPLLTLLLFKAGMSLPLLAKNLLRPAVGMLLIIATVWPTDRLVHDALLRLVIGCVASGLLYLAAVYPMRRIAEAMWNMPSTGPVEVPDTPAVDELVVESLAADSVRKFE